MSPSGSSARSAIRRPRSGTSPGAALNDTPKGAKPKDSLNRAQVRRTAARPSEASSNSYGRQGRDSETSSAAGKVTVRHRGNGFRLESGNATLRRCREADRFCVSFALPSAPSGASKSPEIDGRIGRIGGTQRWSQNPTGLSRTPCFSAVFARSRHRGRESHSLRQWRDCVRQTAKRRPRALIGPDGCQHAIACDAIRLPRLSNDLQSVSSALRCANRLRV